MVHESVFIKPSCTPLHSKAGRRGHTAGSTPLGSSFVVTLSNSWEESTVITKIQSAGLGVSMTKL